MFWVHLAASKHPERVAVEDSERILTYAELCKEAIAAAGALQARRRVRRAGSGPRVALALAPGPEFVIALHGCLLAGAAAVPIDLRLTEGERAARSATADLIVTEPLRGRPPAPPARPRRRPVESP